MRDLVDIAGGQRPDAAPQMLRRARPRRIRMRIVRLPTDGVDPDVLSIAQSKVVIDEACDDMPSKHIAGLFLAEIRMGPGPMLGVGEIRALEEVGNPADPPFGERHTQPRIA